MSNDFMLVKITKADKEKWYADLVGEVLCVRREMLNGNHSVFPGTIRCSSVRAQDCEEVFAVDKENFELLKAPHAKKFNMDAIASLKELLDLPPVAPIDYSGYQFGGDESAEVSETVKFTREQYEFLTYGPWQKPAVSKPKVHRIQPPKPQFWPGAYVVSMGKLSSRYGSIPAGTIFQLGDRLTVCKPMKSIPCSCCGVSLDVEFKGSREVFLRHFYFVLRTEGPEVEFTQAILMGGENE